MAFEVRSGEVMELTLHTQAQGHAFVMEQARLGHLTGAMSTREGLVHRIVGESGGGQARAFLPGGMGGAPTVVPAKPAGS
jgi:hypothetical protein